jgi:acyl carrier protein
MNALEVKKIIKEFAGIRKDAGRDETALLEVALFIEEIFGFVLTDEEISENNLGTHEETEKFVLKKLNMEEGCVESVE